MYCIILLKHSMNGALSPLYLIGITNLRGFIEWHIHFLFWVCGYIFVIKLTVQSAINDSFEEIKPIIKEAIIEGLSEYEYKKQRK